MAAVQLSGFLRRAAGRPFVWGRHDCLMWLADWIAELRGVDPAAAWRGAYDSPLGAARIVRDAGGMVAHVERVVAPLGIRRTDAPCRGDIGIVESAGRLEGAIVTNAFGRVAQLGDRRIVFHALPIRAAWAVPQ